MDQLPHHVHGSIWGDRGGAVQRPTEGVAVDSRDGERLAGVVRGSDKEPLGHVEPHVHVAALDREPILVGRALADAHVRDDRDRPGRAMVDGPLDDRVLPKGEPTNTPPHPFDFTWGAYCESAPTA